MLSNKNENELIDYSNSSLINNIINCDKYKLSELINTIIENNVNHIKTSINKSVAEQIHSSINHFYKNDIDYEKELYINKNLYLRTAPYNGSDIKLSSLTPNPHKITDHRNGKEIYNKFKEDNYDYFYINYDYRCGSGNGTDTTTLIFNKKNILKISSSMQNDVACTLYTNIFTPQVLFTLKLIGSLMFYSDENGKESINFTRFYHEYSKQRHYFIDNNLKIENIIKLEKEKYSLEVDKLKKEQENVEELIEELESNKEYYKELENKFIQFEKDKIKLEEDKKKLFQFKHKLQKMKNDILKEKEEINQLKKELEENEEIDIEEFEKELE